MPNSIRILEVGPRDGLQNEAGEVPVEAKVALVEALAAAGLPEIEVGAFVNPKLVPQMAESAEVFRRMRRREGVVYSALVPNRRGAEAAIEAGADLLSVFASASESFSRRNTNASIAESLARFEPVFEIAAGASRPVRAYVSCAFGCPDEGEVDPTRVASLARELVDAGASEIDVSDTIGVAVPRDVDRVLDAVGAEIDPSRIALHFHDTRGTAIANVMTAIDRGVTRFDSSCGGLGGCPFAPGASGNLATEDLLYVCARSGIETGASLADVAAASSAIGEVLGRRLPSKALAAVRSGVGNDQCRSEDGAARR
ncbi:MAG: hydroxymethylglutaryl-CoA lyase [Phycisphaerales bacterium]|jgi:hydroxymethylglutaryl-CoA lyase